VEPLDLPVDDKSCQLNRSIQQHPVHCDASAGETFSLAILGQNVARAAFGLV